MTYQIDYPERLIHRLLARQVATRPARIFLADSRRTLSYAATADSVARVAAGLRQAGVQAGDRVALMLPNGIEFVLFWMACARLSATSIFINPDYTGEMVDYVFGDAQPCGLVTHASVVPNLQSRTDTALAGLRWICTLEEPGPWHDRRVLAPEAFFDAAPLDDAEAPEGDPSAPNCVVYTSGTTGPSKGAVLSSAALLAGACTFVELAELTADDILFTPLPLFHGLASRQGVMGCLIAGARAHIGERFSASRFWAQARAAGATLAHTMFNIPAMLKAQPADPQERDHTLRLMYNANFDEAFETRFGVPLLESYGLVETGITIYAPCSRRVPGSCGRLHPDWEARIVGPDGLALPDGQSGELWLRPRRPGLFMSGYLNKPLATLEACRDFWFHTGDFLYRDSGGNFYFAGRQKERIRRRGENISAWEIERVAAEHDDVRLCAAIGHPAEVGDDDVRLVLTLKAGATLAPEALHQWLGQRLPRFMVPRYIEIVEHLPLTPTEKVRKNEVIAAGLGPTAWDAEAGGRQARAAHTATLS